MVKDSQSLLGAFNIKKFISLCFKSWYVFAVTIGLCLCLAMALIILRPQKSEVLAQIMLKDGGGMGLAGQIASSYGLGDMLGGSSTTDNESFVLGSHTVFLQTVKQMDLNTIYYARPFPLMATSVTSSIPYRLTAPDMCADTLRVPIVFELKRKSDDRYSLKMKVDRDVVLRLDDQSMPLDLNTPYGNFKIETTQYFNPEITDKKYNILYMSYNAAASFYEKLVSIYVPDRKSDFIDLSFVTSDPAFGKNLLNHIINNYIVLSNVFKEERTTESLSLVDQRLASLASELVFSEAAMEKFKKEHNLTDVEADAQYLMTKTGTIETSLFEAQTNFELVKLTREFLRNPDNNYSLIPDLFMNSGSLSSENGSLVSQYNQLILQRMELSDFGKTNNSAVRQLDGQIDALRANILTSIDRIYQNSALTLQDLKKEDSKNKSRLNTLPTIEREYLVLKRDNMLQEQLYLYLLQQREELNMTMASRSIPAQVIDYPYVLSDPPGLSTKLKLALALFFGLLLGAAYVFFVKMRKAPVTTRSEVDALIKAPIFQHIATDADAAAPTFGKGAENDETFRHLRSDVQSALKECDGHVAVVTSMRDAEGKTYVAVNLAESLAVIGKRVVLVDASMRAPGVAKALSLHGEAGIEEYLRSDSQAPNIQHVSLSNGSRLDVITANHAAADAGDLVASERFAHLIHELSDTYDYVIVDGSRISGYSDIFYLTDIADLTLVVLRAGVSTPAEIEALNALYDNARLKRIAVVASSLK